MFIRRTVIAAALIAVPIALAAPAQATCSYFGDKESDPGSQGICGAPDITNSIQKAGENLRTNFDVAEASKNLEHNLTHGVGEQDQNAP
jgi:hypothetical protein